MMPTTTITIYITIENTVWSRKKFFFILSGSGFVVRIRQEAAAVGRAFRVAGMD